MNLHTEGKIILVETNDNSTICSINGVLYSNQTSHECEVRYHLHVLSDDKIKVGDWVLMFDDFGNLFLGSEPVQYLGIEAGHHLNRGLKKIIASTKYLPIRYDERYDDIIVGGKSLNLSIPQIPEIFIDQYITEYNNSNIITDVLIELNDKLKLIRTKPVKESFSREEVKVLLERAFSAGTNKGMALKIYNDEISNCESGSIEEKIADEKFDKVLSMYKWIEKNL